MRSLNVRSINFYLEQHSLVCPPYGVARMSSAVFVMSSAAKAWQAAAAIWESAEPGPVRECLIRRREKERVTVQAEGSPRGEVVGGKLYADVRSERLVVPIDLPGVYGIRTTGRYLLPWHDGASFTEDVFTFAAGRAVVLLDSGAIGRPARLSRIRSLIRVLHTRAFADIGMLGHGEKGRRLHDH
jgi:hypothetical protein